MLFDNIIYGPIHSRRLGVSLGINLLPTQIKLCTFDCIYCECGFNQPVTHPVLPTREQVREALEQTLLPYSPSSILNPSSSILLPPPDVITFSGNGEPTLHPDFAGIIEDTCQLRDKYCPQAKVSVLSNATQLGRKDVVEALRRCDNRILKLDSGIDATMRLIDAPVNKQLKVEDIVQKLKVFDADFTLQTCFLRGQVNGQEVDNTTPQEVEAWYKVVRELRPKQIMIYVIDRATPVKTLEKISRTQMEAIAQPLRKEGFDIIICA